MNCTLPPIAGCLCGALCCKEDACGTECFAVGSCVKPRESVPGLSEVCPCCTVLQGEAHDISRNNPRCSTSVCPPQMGGMLSE